MLFVMYLYILVEYISHQIKHITIISVYSLLYYNKLFILHLELYLLFGMKTIYIYGYIMLYIYKKGIFNFKEMCVRISHE